jgi:hypothetical protein
VRQDQQRGLGQVHAVEQSLADVVAGHDYDQPSSATRWSASCSLMPRTPPRASTAEHPMMAHTLWFALHGRGFRCALCGAPFPNSATTSRRGSGLTGAE